MNKTLNSFKMVFLCYKNGKIFNGLSFILAPIVAIPGLIFIEPAGSEDYMMPIFFIGFSLIIFLLGFNGYNFHLNTRKKFFFSSVIGKNLYSTANILFNNFLGLIFIFFFSIVKLILAFNGIGSMSNFSNTLSLLLVLLGVMSVINIVIIFNILLLFIIIPIILLSYNIFKHNFIFLGLLKELSNNKPISLLFIGLALNIILNLAAYLYSIHKIEGRLYNKANEK